MTVFPNPAFSVNNLGPFCLDASDDTLTAAFTSSVPNCDTSYVIDAFELNAQFADTEYVNLIVGQEYEITEKVEFLGDFIQAISILPQIRTPDS